MHKKKLPLPPHKKIFNTKMFSRVIRMNDDNDKAYTCKQEARLTAIETKLENKKEHLHEVDDDYHHLNEQLTKISLNLATISTTMETLIENRKETNDKILALQLEMKELKTNWQNIKWMIGVGVPILTTVLTILANYFL